MDDGESSRGQDQIIDSVFQPAGVFQLATASVKSAKVALKKRHRFALTRSRFAREEKYFSPAPGFATRSRGNRGIPPTGSGIRHWAPVENSPQVCCQTRTCSEKARIYVGQLLSPASSAARPRFSFFPRLEEEPPLFARTRANY